MNCIASLQNAEHKLTCLSLFPDYTGIPLRLVQAPGTVQGRGKGAVRIPGLGTDSCLWDSTDRMSGQRCGVTFFDSLPTNFCYRKKVGRQRVPFGVALNIFGYLSPSK